MENPMARPATGPAASPTAITGAPHPPVPSDPEAIQQQQLQRLVEEADFGGRRPTGAAASLIFAIAATWSLFQLWFASPLPFVLNVGFSTTPRQERSTSRPPSFLFSCVIR